MVGQFMRRRQYEEKENENDANMCAFVQVLAYKSYVYSSLISTMFFTIEH